MSPSYQSFGSFLSSSVDVRTQSKRQSSSLCEATPKHIQLQPHWEWTNSPDLGQVSEAFLPNITNMLLRGQVAIDHNSEILNMVLVLLLSFDSIQSYPDLIQFLRPPSAAKKQQLSFRNI